MRRMTAASEYWTVGWRSSSIRLPGERAPRAREDVARAAARQRLVDHGAEVGAQARLARAELPRLGGVVDDDRLLERLQDLALEPRPRLRRASARRARRRRPSPRARSRSPARGRRRTTRPQDDEHRQEGGDEDEAPGPHPCTADSRCSRCALPSPASRLSPSGPRAGRRALRSWLGELGQRLGLQRGQQSDELVGAEVVVAGGALAEAGCRGAGPERGSPGPAPAGGRSAARSGCGAGTPRGRARSGRRPGASPTMAARRWCSRSLITASREV